MRDRAKWIRRLDKTLKLVLTSAANIRVIISPSKRPARKHKNQGVNCVPVLPYENERQHNRKAIANLITSMNFLM